MNPLSFRYVLIFRLYGDDDESDIESILKLIRCILNTVLCTLLSGIEGGGNSRVGLKKV